MPARRHIPRSLRVGDPGDDETRPIGSAGGLRERGRPMTTQVLYPILYLEINLTAILLILFIRFKTLGISKMVSQRNFSFAIDAEIVFFLSDTVAVLISCGLIPFSRAGLLASKTVYFFSTALMCFFWFIYFEHLQGSGFVASRKLVLISSCLVWAMAVLLLVNLPSGILFYVDDGDVYHRGPFFLLQYLLSYIYVFAACGHALIGVFRRKNLSHRRLLISLALFPIAPAGAGILQFIYPQLPVACVALAFATMIMYHNWLDEILSMDPLTRLNNRKQLSFHYESWQRQGDSTPLYVLMIDANKFKSINDTYGHIQGDAALERIADALRMACGALPHRANIARYGGDEFVILAKAEEPAVIDRLKERIAAYLEQLNREARAPYGLTVSIGVAVAEKRKALKELIEHADAALYAEKRR